VINYHIFLPDIKHRHPCLIFFKKSVKDPKLLPIIIMIRGKSALSLKAEINPYLNNSVPQFIIFNKERKKMKNY